MKPIRLAGYEHSTFQGVVNHTKHYLNKIQETHKGVSEYTMKNLLY